MSRERVRATDKLKSTIVVASQILNQRFHPSLDLQAAIQPAREDFATVPTENGFNWDRIGRTVRRHEPRGSRKKEKYLVVFRSSRKDDVDISQLEAYDTNAYCDALKSGGLIVYFQGPINETRENVSFCIWRSGQKAYDASHREPHNQAVEIAEEMYDKFELERYLVKTRRTIRGLKTELTRIESNPATASLSSVA